ncbi:MULTISPECIES: hypothetical protein [Streptomyces]|uniref:Uncharacterized protein n=2 Tax=Streptomyces TaxID=1883 RepID=A0ABT9L9F1_STRGD|nr:MULTISPECIES: hypothetical protein [Streptomyces]MDP9680339.1 hypothetical protein [Streptomyces griseoviridis]GGT09301.1 hypothetical protein GCM10010240_48370 [Streptomyces griseoviridis]GGU52793.1 hypothetical protein GCM10010259_50040 [Streptomyces daghestanicus]GHI29143.1 hypothetical protein Sdagh_08730 [Streptomyces daghestanicus]
MSDLLATVLDAYGGRARWEEADRITARQFFGGALWGLKGHPGALDDVEVIVGLKREFVSQKPFFDADHHTSFTADRVAVETSDGDVVEELTDPRASFAGHDLTTPWTRLQLAYFSGSAMWTYLAEPISLTFPGVRTEEIDPFTEDGEKYRRLRVVFPDYIATLSTEQVLYVDGDGLIRRRDYDVEIAGNTPGAHFISGHQEVDGLVIPTTREIYSRDENGHKVPDPLVVSVRLEDIRVS